MSNMLDKTKFIEAKAEGKNNTEAALQAGSKTPRAARQAGYRLNRQPDIQKQLNKSIKRHNITVDLIMTIYAEAAKAEKVVIVGKGDDAFADVTPDHMVRMKAADKFSDLLGINSRLKSQNTMSQNITQQMTPELQAAINSGDEVELQRAVFRKVE
jgi:phage terminase small subunit